MNRVVGRCLSVAILASATTLAYSAEQTDTVGGGGGASFYNECGSNGVLAGVDVRSGLAIDAVTTRCVGVSSSGQWLSDPFLSGGQSGGAGGVLNTLQCPADHAVVGIRTSLGRGGYSYVVGGLQLQCRALNGVASTVGGTISTDVSGYFDDNPRTLDCATDSVARGLFGKSGSLVDQIGVICEEASEASRPPSGGQWSPVQDWPLIAIHAVLTPQGQVLTFGTNDAGVQGAQFYYDVWDPVSNSHQTLNNTLQVDSFCSAPLVLPETGNIIMPGGDARYGGGQNKGIVDAPLFNPDTFNLSRAASMAYARWYPTATTLPGGEILVTGGIDGAGNPSITPEVYSSAGNSWRSLFGASNGDIFGSFESRWWYPRQWVAPNGEVFGMTGSSMFYLSTDGGGSIREVGTVPVRSRNFRSTAVMYAPGKILQVGGEGNNGAITVDINSGSPVVRDTQSMSFNRNAWATSTVLPDGKVLVVGGSPSDNQLEGAVTTPEVWDPATGTWTSLAEARLARLYHSSALLLPDGRVLVAGGGAPGPLTNTNAEIFTPPYLINADGSVPSRLEIYQAPGTALHGRNITVNHSGNQTVERVTLIKTGSVTHSFNMDQRFLELSFSRGQGEVYIDLPASVNNAPPGYYMLFLIDQNGTPSVGRLINMELERSDSDNSGNGGSGNLIQTGTGYCLDVSGAGVANETNIQQWTCNGTGAQAWDLVPTNGGFMVRNENSGKCLDVAGASTDIGANVQQLDCAATAQQTLTFENGALKFQHSGLCLDVAGGSTTSGANIQQWTCNGTAAQQFSGVGLSSSAASSVREPVLVAGGGALGVGVVIQLIALLVIRRRYS